MSFRTVPRARAVLARIGLIAGAALIAATGSFGVAAAEPTEPPSSPPPSSSETTEPAPEPSTPVEEPGAPSTAPPTSSPAERDQTAAAVELEVTAEFDKASYRTGEQMNISFSIENVGTERAVDITKYQPPGSPDAIQTDYESWGDLMRGGVTIEAGDTVSVDVVGRVANPAATTGLLAGILFDGSGPAVAYFSFSVPVTPTFGQAGGIVYADENDNARYDQGEGLPGAEVRLINYYHTDDAYTATTDADGEFSFPRVPTVRMQLATTAPGWLIGYQYVVIDETDTNDNLRVRAARPTTGLSVSLAFREDTYQPNATATVDVTLTNSSDRPFAGIVANCNRVGNSNSLSGRGAGWGDLAGDGVTIGAGQTRTFVVTETVPEAAFDYGHVNVGCDFSYANTDDPDGPSDFDVAQVPGGFGTIDGKVADNAWTPEEVGVENVRVVLVRDDRCPIVAETRTNAQGQFEFNQVAAGNYQLYLFPPAGWLIEYENPTGTMVFAGDDTEMSIEAEPGSAPPPTLPEQPGDCAAPGGPAPGPQGSPGPAGLAYTGASVVGFAVSGLAAIAAGVGGILLTRRRRTSPS